MSEDFYKGMIQYEKICEEILVKLKISEQSEVFIQTQILDKAQAEFERRNT